MAGKTVTKETAGLPDLVATRPEDFQIDARDIQPPRLKVASPTTGPAAEGLVPLYSLFSQRGKEDDEPQVLVQPGDTDGVKVYVLKMYKTKSANVDPADWNREKRQGGELRSWQFNDPTAPEFARTQYNYVCYVPESETPDMPHNLLLGNTSTGTARFINTLLLESQREGKPIISVPFSLWPEKKEAERDGTTNRWAIFKAKPAQADPDEVQAAQQLLSLFADKQPAVAVDATEPEAAPAI